jgi:hypothetical protein
LQEGPDAHPHADLASSDTVADANCAADPDADPHPDA